MRKYLTEKPHVVILIILVGHKTVEIFLGAEVAGNYYWVFEIARTIAFGG